MLAYVVLFLGILYLVLHYSGALEEWAQRAGRSTDQPSGEGRRKKLSAGIDREIERRLEVFEDFLKRDEPPADEG